MIRDTTLTNWLLEQFGKGKRYGSMRDLSLACGPDPGMVAKILAKGTATAPALLKLAEALEEKPSRLFVLADWLSPGELEEVQLTKEEEQVLEMVRALPQERRRVLLEVAEAMREPASRQRAQPRAAEASARYQAVPRPR